MPQELWYTSALLGVVAFTLMTWRVIAYWQTTNDLVHCLGILLIGSLLIGAVQNYTSLTQPHNVDAVDLMRIGHRSLCIAFALIWPLLVKRDARIRA